ncbi:MAG: cation transporter [Bacteriovoracia bacterium]
MDSCCKPVESPKAKAAKLVLWVALVINFGMFLVEGAFGFKAASTSLKADASDFLGDSASYVITLLVFDKGAKPRWWAAFIKAALMFAIGLGVLGAAFYRAFYGIMPEAPTMGWVGLSAFLANLIVAALLYRFRNHDINMESAWLCSFNDVVGNIAVVAAAGGVWFTVSRWPDLIVASIISGLNLWGSFKVGRKLILERKLSLSVSQ